MKVVFAALLACVASTSAFTGHSPSFARTSLRATEVETETVTEAVEVETPAAPVMETMPEVTLPTELKGNFQRTAPAAMADYAGAIEPVGFWDPFFLTKGQDDATLLKYREMEIAHSRVAMLAFIGMIVSEKITGVSSPQTLAETDLSFWLGALIPIGIIESAHAKLPYTKKLEGVVGEGFYDWEYKGEKYVPGDFGVEYFYAQDVHPETFKMFQSFELSNGRLAMLGFMGTYAQEVISGSPTF